ncbi:Calcium-gated potassium channel MthK [Candidatus Norongarragalina meridionalis]|nr:Calcium-gated potassium channel MthK [Candidatus Norongarragalina meridionalis]
MVAHAPHRKTQTIDYRKYAILLVILVLVFALSVANMILVEKKTFGEAMLETTCTSLYVDCSGSVGMSTKMIHILLGLTTMAVGVFLVSEVVQMFVRNEFGGGKMAKKIASMRNHMIICGYGALGKTIAGVLESRKVPYVVIDVDKRVCDSLAEQGIPCVEGDALDVAILQKAGVRNAKRVVAALNSDSSNVFLTLTVKDLTPGIEIATRAYTEDAVSKLHRAGADVIVMPDVIGGMEMAREILNLKESFVQNLLSVQRKRS